MIKAFFINLDRRRDRLDRMSRQFAAAGISALRWPAKDGNSLSREERSLFDKTNLGPSQIGCFLSHVAIWKWLLASNENAVAVFEDDLAISTRLKHLLEDDSWLAPDAEIIRLETALRQTRLTGIRPSGIKGFSIGRLRKRAYGTGGYIVTRRGAERLLGGYCRPINNIDILLYDPWLHDGKGPLRVFQVLPAPVSQLQFLYPRKFAHESDIVTDRKLQSDAREVYKTGRSSASLPRKLIYELGDIARIVRRLPRNIFVALTSREMVVPFDSAYENAASSEALPHRAETAGRSRNAPESTHISG
ncbi:glycosyltransferase family 25 protein [Rhizobiales bacterium]|uniref:glycosyltransferase family 25 protein n=1 Tax=Hongsoonwoonella zoysiae TaxID=2821844 RepID=UPI0015619336|nr:glycosyltransferase family 25 protein [Hongsoonwoonella zoysiae]NRG17635.1 glycosyltransferase family 25 protein [Hongsoonwoonella zoysiae]